MSLDFYIFDKPKPRTESVLELNITGNLTKMAQEAGVYNCLWGLPETGFKFPYQLIPQLEKAIKDMKSRPQYYKQFNPENGWGSYDSLLEDLEELLKICKEHPGGSMLVSR